MDRVCQYSTIIFAGNVVVLVLVALSTDYWRYHGFHTSGLLVKLAKSEQTQIVRPHDTDTYIIARYFWDPSQVGLPLPTTEANFTYYQPPLLLYRYERFVSEAYRARFFNGTHNVTEIRWRTTVLKMEDVLVIFLQYTNLFRDCDDLEIDVRNRLGIEVYRGGRCFNFITSVRRRDDFIVQELPAVIHLERIAFFLGIVCIIASVVSVCGGIFGSLFHDKYGMLTASSAALVSGMTLTVCIAIFHAKCNLIERHELLAGVQVAHKDLLQEFRIHYFGWSFVLAWICIALCFLHTWVWLSKAQDMPEMSPKLTSERKFNEVHKQHLLVLED